MMETAVIPSSCAVALKEWASVLTALGGGEQLILIRKGGLIEPGSGFELVSPIFVLYPTFEHQTVNFLRAPYQRYFHEAIAQRPPQEQIRFEFFGMAVSSAESRDPAIIERLSPFHVYNEAFLHQRLKWKPEQPLVIVIMRAFQLAAPRTIPLVPRYAGCRSWVELESPVPLEGARPVLDDARFRQRAQEIASLLAPP